MQRGGLRDATSTALTVTLFALVMAAVVLSASLIRPPGASATAGVSDLTTVECPAGFHAPVCYHFDLTNAGRGAGSFRCLLVSGDGNGRELPRRHARVRHEASHGAGLQHHRHDEGAGPRREHDRPAWRRVRPGLSAGRRHPTTSNAPSPTICTPPATSIAHAPSAAATSTWRKLGRPVISPWATTVAPGMPGEVMEREVRAQRARGGARGGVLADRVPPIEHARHHVPIPADREQVEGLGILGRLANRAAQVLVADGAAKSGLVAHRHHQVRDAGGDRHDRQPVDQIVRLQACGVSDRRAIGHLASELRRQLPHPGAPRGQVHRDRHVPRRRRLYRARGDPALADQREGGPERGMSGERQLLLRGEDPHVIAVCAHGRHERGLREVDLAGERQHLPRGQLRRRLRDHAQLVPGERHRGEHIENHEWHTHGRQYRSGAGVR